MNRRQLQDDGLSEGLQISLKIEQSTSQLSCYTCKKMIDSVYYGEAVT